MTASHVHLRSRAWRWCAAGSGTRPEGAGVVVVRHEAPGGGGAWQQLGDTGGLDGHRMQHHRERRHDDARRKFRDRGNFVFTKTKRGLLSTTVGTHTSMAPPQH
eukprot:scaffold16222_cov146-Isochrysis_galbana.AAC.3